MQRLCSSLDSRRSFSSFLTVRFLSNRVEGKTNSNWRCLWHLYRVATMPAWQESIMGFCRNSNWGEICGAREKNLFNGGRQIGHFTVCLWWSAPERLWDEILNSIEGITDILFYNWRYINTRKFYTAPFHSFLVIGLYVCLFSLEAPPSVYTDSSEDYLMGLQNGHRLRISG